MLDTLDSIVFLEHLEIQNMLKTIPNDKLLLALKVAKPIVVALVMRNLSQRASKMVWHGMCQIEFEHVEKAKVEAAIAAVKAAIVELRQVAA